MTYLPADTRYEAMRYNRCGRSGLKLPAVSLGLWHNFGGVDTLENARALIRRAFDLGITHFDLANNYDAARLSRENFTGGSAGTGPLPRQADHLNQGRLGHVRFGDLGSRGT